MRCDEMRLEFRQKNYLRICTPSKLFELHGLIGLFLTRSRLEVQSNASSLSREKATSRLLSVLHLGRGIPSASNFDTTRRAKRKHGTEQ